MFGYIYKTTNKINNKIYIGQHKSNSFDSTYLGSGKMITEAINKYGKHNFSVELLECCYSREDLDSKEIYYIDYYNSTNNDIGYNICRGGQVRFFTRLKHSTESKKKMSDSAKKRGMHQSCTTKGKICITDGVINKMILPEYLSTWIEKGWHRGKTCNRVPWNKGLTKQEDSRLADISKKYKEKFESGAVIGCCGVKGNTWGFKKGQPAWNKGYVGFCKGHPNYYHGKKNK